MPTLPLSGRRPASARRQLLAVLTAAFLAFQQLILLAPTAAAQTRRPTTTLAKPTATKAPARSPKLTAPTQAGEPGPSSMVSPDLVISQVYGGGGNTGATYTHDFVELFNRGSSAVSLAGKSVQYTSATGTGNFAIGATVSGTLQPGQYYLVQMASNANVGSPLPTPNATGNSAMAAGAGKVALVNSTSNLPCNGGSDPCTAGELALIIDLVGYGTANFFEGAGPAPTISATLADFRAAAGCTDTDNNNADFSTATPAPRNTSTALNPCSGPPPLPSLAVNDVSQDEGNAGTTAFTFTVSLSSATHGGVTFDICTADGTAQDDNPTTEDNDYAANCLTGQSIPNGSSSYQFTVNVNGDTTTEPNETFFVNITNVVGATATDGQGQGTIVNDEVTITPIHEVQGSTPTVDDNTDSPRLGQTVTTTGIVTLLKTGSNAGAGAANGFFLQTPDADADSDPNTSQGIFVFTSSVPTVAVGDEVRVSGTVIEFNGLTEIGSVTSVSVIDTGNPLPTAVTLDTTILDPTAAPTQPQLEKYEGMRLTGTLKTVAPNDNFYDVDTVLSTVPRPVREPGIPVSQPVPPDPTTGTPDPNVPRWDENPERLKVDTNGRAGSANTPYTSNVTFTAVAGPLDYAFGEYRLIADATPAASANMPVTAVGPPEENEFTVASYNIENFNNNATQRQKAASTIRSLLFTPEIIGTIEIDDLAHLQALGDEVDANTAGDPQPTQYEAYLSEGNSSTGGDVDQNVGFLVDTARVQVNAVTQERKDETYTEPGGATALLHDRPPLVLDATVDPSGASPQRVIVVVNHLRSFICIDADVDPAEAAQCTGGAADGPRVRAKRKAQAESLADLLNDLQTANPGVPVISVGDYNAYEFNNGFDDPVSVIKGNPTPDDQIVVDQSPDLVNPDFFNLIETLPPVGRYSFIFEGTPQALDHHLVNAAGRSRNSRIAIARVNADFPEAPAAAYASNPATPARNSDHDPVVSYYRLGAAQAAGSLIISEFRFRGPGTGDELGPVQGGGDDAPGGPSVPGTPAEGDEFVELYNNTDSDITVTTLDGSAGWAVVAADGVTRFIVPNETVIPARGYFLAGGPSYTLGSYGPPDEVLLPSDTSTRVTAYADHIPDGSGIALFSTAEPSNYTLASRIDAAGYATVDALYREGAGFPAAGAEATSDLEHSFVRRVCVFGGPGCGGPGLPKDSSENALDFVVVNTEGEAAPTTLGAKLGAPGPQGLTSPYNGNAGMTGSLLDPSVSSSQPPNRVREFGMVPNGTFGTLSIRRTITNNTGLPVNYLAFRIIDLTTNPVPAGTADLRALDSADIQVTVNGSPVDVLGTFVEQPPTQPNGGGLNSSLAVGTIDLDNQIEPGESVNVQFLLGIMQTGGYRFYVNIEIINGEGEVPAGPVSLTSRNLKKLRQQQRSKPQRPRINRR